MSTEMVALGVDQSKIVQLTGIILGATLNNGTGVATGAPNTLALGANTITTTTKGTFIVNVPSGSGGTVATAGATVSGSPVTLAPGSNVITTTTTGTITVTITVTATAEVIEVPQLRTIQAVISASLSAGYKLDPANITIAGNKLTIQPMFYHYDSGGAADGPAINVPTTTDLSAVTCNLTVLGY
jgi:hypothetical protein